MSRYYYGNNKHYISRRSRKMKFRKPKLVSKFELTILFVIFSYVGLRINGTTDKDFVALLSACLLLWAIVYTFYKLFIPIVRSVSSLVKLRSRRENQDVDTMTGVEFEHFVARILKSRGCTNVRLTEHYDFGVDIVAEKDGVTWGIQTKRYKNAVNAEAVRQVVTALKGYECDRSMVITNSPIGYTRPARELARTNNCVLVDRNILKKWVQDYDTGRNRKMGIH